VFDTRSKRAAADTKLAVDGRRVEFPSAAGTGDEGSYKQRDVGGCRNVATEDGEVQSAQVMRRPLREHTGRSSDGD
jgi:hypothetical protein